MVAYFCPGLQARYLNHVNMQHKQAYMYMWLINDNMRLINVAKKYNYDEMHHT